MTAKQYLSQVKWIELEIKSRQMEVEELRAIAEGCSAKQITGMPGGSGSSDKLGNTVARMVDIENSIIDKINTLYVKREIISEQIDAMQNGEYRELLRRRYLLNQKWEDIAEALEYTTRNCTRIHGYALAEFTKMYQCVLTIKCP